MSVVVRGRDETMRDVDVCESLREFIQHFRGRVDRVGFVDGDEGRIVAHYKSATIHEISLTVVTQLQ
jgi:hypothetical protein